MDFLEKVKEAKKETKARKFKQTWDLVINVTGLDLKKPEHRFNLEFSLPEGRGKDVKIAAIVDSGAAEARAAVDTVISKADIDVLARDKKRFKKMVSSHAWFIAEAPLMPLVGKSLGVILGTRGKMPKPIPPKVKLDPLVQAIKKSVRVSLKSSPVVHVIIGSEDMPEDKVAKNAQAVYNFVRDKLPKGETNIRSVYVKLTMGRPVKVA